MRFLRADSFEVLYDTFKESGTTQPNMVPADILIHRCMGVWFNIRQFDEFSTKDLHFSYLNFNPKQTKVELSWTHR